MEKIHILKIFPRKCKKSKLLNLRIVSKMAIPYVSP